ncbi:hypothetical protein H2201_003061 [Coniosporium apollinis]|uniref:Uncharacterized protein n=1 Tax=Coniosporium apollinis TaxID=61459 RepID=A0ABQ9NXU7_9PEZI|nr:hypothetical protein H2201_003061 [Coniosporium apollinis]
MPNLFHLLAPPVLLSLSIPLALLAIITTSLAFSTLLIRVSIVYFELGVALLHSYLFVPPPKRSYPRTPPYSVSPGRTSPRHPRANRRTSTTSTASAQDPTTSTSGFPPIYPTKSGSFASLTSSLGPARDYEGVGGWRVSSGDGSEEALWIGMNSRLELPAVVSPNTRRHQRSLTGPSLRGSWSPEAVRMSPVRMREGRGGSEEYFGVVQGKGEGEVETGKVRKERSRKGSSGSSTSSGSSALTSLRRVSAGGS